MDALLAHPHDDTPPAIAVVLDDPELTVGAILARCDARAEHPRVRKSQSPRLKRSDPLSRTH
jgi:hypothetical protein